MGLKRIFTTTATNTILFLLTRSRSHKGDPSKEETFYSNIHVRVLSSSQRE